VKGLPFATAIALVCVVLVCCMPHDAGVAVVNVVPDASDAAAVAAASSAAVTACATAKRLGCGLGATPECEYALRVAILESDTTLAVVACAGGAPTPPAFTACAPDFFAGACATGTP
jgi:hypothetical protein